MTLADIVIGGAAAIAVFAIGFIAGAVAMALLSPDAGDPDPDADSW